MLVGLHRSRCGPHIKQVNSKQCKQKKGNGGLRGSVLLFERQYGAGGHKAHGRGQTDAKLLF